LAVTPLQVFAEEQVSTPAIEVLSSPPPKNYPIRIYVYRQAYVNEQSQDVFQCRWTDQIISVLYEVLPSLRGSIMRFAEEHPEYRELGLIYFVTVSNPSEADIVVKIVGMISENMMAGGIARVGSKPIEIDVLCEVGNGGQDVAFNMIAHEILHALGLGHAKQQTTEDGSQELMWPKSTKHTRTYPSTLDLYALYVIHFGSASNHVVTLPHNLRYEMVIPYAVEIQALRQENAKLKDQINTSTMLFEKLRQERDALRDKLSEVNATLQDLSGQYQAIRNILDSYIRAYNSLQQKYENLRGNCSLLLNVCNQTYHELTAKLGEKHAALVNMTAQYNQCANQFNRLYEEHQKLQAEYDDLAGRFSFLAITYFAVVAILGGGALWVSLAWGRLRDRYHELLEKLEGGGKQDE
jgi:regulator of replication initiation timing